MLNKKRPESFLIRVDASVSIGTGHVMRCLTLATELRERGARVAFACREHEGHLCDLIGAQGFKVDRLARVPATLAMGSLEENYGAWLGVSEVQDAADMVGLMKEPFDWLIVDHYGIGENWERRIRPLARHLMVIDDLGDRKHDCDLLLDQTLRVDAGRPYEALVPKGCTLLLGASFAMLRAEFAQARTEIRKNRKNPVQTGLVYFGGSDVTGETLKALQGIRSFEEETASAGVRFDVVVGVNNPRRLEIMTLSSQLGSVTLHQKSMDMAKLMLAADFALGAGGTTTWERACLGLPSLVIASARNQLPGATGMAAAGAHWLLGESEQVDSGVIHRAILKAVQTPDLLRELSRKSMTIVDGAGAGRVAAVLLES